MVKTKRSQCQYSGQIENVLDNTWRVSPLNGEPIVKIAGGELSECCKAQKHPVGGAVGTNKVT